MNRHPVPTELIGRDVHVVTERRGYIVRFTGRLEWAGRGAFGGVALQLLDEHKVTAFVGISDVETFLIVPAEVSA